MRSTPGKTGFVVAIVDDDRDVRESLEAMCHAEALLCRTFESAEALADTIPADFDMLIVDINLPGMNGFSLVRLLRARGCHSPVLLFTGRQDERFQPLADSLPKTQLLIKGRDSDILRRELRSLRNSLQKLVESAE